MALPYFQTSSKDLSLLQTGWAQQLNPLLGNPANSTVLLNNIILKPGNNVINHTLGKKMQGFVVSDIDSPITLYRTQPFNDLTLTLSSSGSATINLLVF